MPEARRQKTPSIVATVSVAGRLSRMEALLIEMRHEQDVHLKRLTELQEQIDNLTEHVTDNSRSIRRMSVRNKLARR
jgi:hypothetical protein